MGTYVERVDVISSKTPNPVTLFPLFQITDVSFVTVLYWQGIQFIWTLTGPDSAGQIKEQAGVQTGVDFEIVTHVTERI